MEMLQTITKHCPYCDEPIDLVVDCSVASQTYTEDCQVCCQPMVVRADILPGQSPVIQLRREDD